MPPPANTDAVPLDPPKQLTGVALHEAVTAVGVPTVDWHVKVHPLASVTVTVYVPAVNPLIDEVIAVVLHRYEYPGVPPPAVTLAVPLDPPKQLTAVALHEAVTAVGEPTVDWHVNVHPLASVTVTV